MSQWTRARRAAAALGAVAALVAGCGQATDQGSPGGASSSAASSTDSGAPSPSGSASSSSAGGCLTRNLSFTVNDLGAAAGSAYSRIVMTNRGSAPCVTGGYGGVSFVDAHGRQLGAPAQRDRSAPVKRIVLAPGERAAARLQTGAAGNYPAARCHPAHADGLRIYPPNETHATVVDHVGRACRSDQVHLLRLKPYRKLG